VWTDGRSVGRQVQDSAVQLGIRLHTHSSRKLFPRFLTILRECPGNLMSSESGPDSAEIVDENSGTGSDPFFRGPFELY